MTLSQKSIDEFKEIYKKEHGEELSDDEASESAHNLVGFVNLLWKCAVRDTKKKERLKKEPDGFPVDGQYSCLVCGCSIDPETGWYDKWGQKCLPCTKAIKNGVIPAFVCRDHDSYYKTWELKDKFKIHPQTARKMVRAGELKARIITTEENKPYEYIFLKKENLQLISRYSPERKSYDRHRKKEDVRRAREWKIEMSEKIKLTRATAGKKRRIIDPDTLRESFV